MPWRWLDIGPFGFTLINPAGFGSPLERYKVLHQPCCTKSQTCCCLDATRIMQRRLRWKCSRALFLPCWNVQIETHSVCQLQPRVNTPISMETCIQYTCKYQIPIPPSTVSTKHQAAWCEVASIIWCVGILYKYIYTWWQSQRSKVAEANYRNTSAWLLTMFYRNRPHYQEGNTSGSIWNSQWGTERQVLDWKCFLLYLIVH